jgi:hypothetical protein
VWGHGQSPVHFSTVEYTTPVRDLPHSKQHGLNREVINPHDGHIVCVPYPAIRGFGLRVLCSSRIVNNAISRPTTMLVGFIKATPSGRLPYRPSRNVLMSAGLCSGHNVCGTSDRLRAFSRNEQRVLGGCIANVSAIVMSASDIGGYCSASPPSRVPILWSWSTSHKIAATACADRALAEKPKMGVLQMDWLRSEDLKEVKVTTAPFEV